MNKFIISIDSSCDISMDFCIKNDVKTLLMKYTIGEDEFKDTMVEDDIKKFYEKMRNGAVPKTSQINVNDYLVYFNKYVDNNLPIIHISLSSGLSGSYQNAEKAVEILKEDNPAVNIKVIDSLMASGGIVLSLLKLIEMRNAGKTVDEAYEYVKSTIRTVNTFFTTPEMVYLYRGGRVKKITALVAGALKMNPILKVDENGKLVSHQVVPGEKRTFKRVLELVEKGIDPNYNDYLIISHSDCLEKAQKFGDNLKEKYNFKEIIYTTIGTTIGAHTGPGLVAIFFYGDERK